MKHWHVSQHLIKLLIVYKYLYFIINIFNKDYDKFKK